MISKHLGLPSVVTVSVVFDKAFGIPISKLVKAVHTVHLLLQCRVEVGLARILVTNIDTVTILILLDKPLAAYVTLVGRRRLQHRHESLGASKIRVQLVLGHGKKFLSCSSLESIIILLVPDDTLYMLHPLVLFHKYHVLPMPLWCHYSFEFLFLVQ